MDKSNLYKKTFESKADYSIVFNGNYFPKLEYEESLYRNEFDLLEKEMNFDSESSDNSDLDSSFQTFVRSSPDDREDINKTLDLTINETFDHSINETMEKMKNKIKIPSALSSLIQSTNDLSYESKGTANSYNQTVKRLFLDSNTLPDPPSDWFSSNLTDNLPNTLQQKPPPIAPNLPHADWFKNSFYSDNLNTHKQAKKPLKDIQLISKMDQNYPYQPEIINSSIKSSSQENSGKDPIRLKKIDNIGTFYFNEEDNPKYNPKHKDNISKIEKTISKDTIFDLNQLIFNPKQENTTSKSVNKVPKEQISDLSQSQIKTKSENIAQRIEKLIPKDLNINLNKSKLNPSQDKTSTKIENLTQKQPKVPATEQPPQQQYFTETDSTKQENSIIKNSTQTTSLSLINTPPNNQDNENNSKSSSPSETLAEVLKSKQDLKSYLMSDQIKSQTKIENETIINLNEEYKQILYNTFSRLPSDDPNVPVKLSVIQETKLKLGLDKIKNNEDTIVQNPLPQNRAYLISKLGQHEPIRIQKSQKPTTPVEEICQAPNDLRNVPLKKINQQETQKPTTLVEETFQEPNDLRNVPLKRRDQNKKLIEEKVSSETKSKENNESFSKINSNSELIASCLKPKTNNWQFEFMYLGKCLDKDIMVAFFECDYLFESFKHLSVVLEGLGGIQKNSIQISKNDNKTKNDIQITYNHDGTHYKEIMVEKIKQYVNETYVTTKLDFHIKFRDDQNEFFEEFLKELKSIETNDVEKIDSHFKSHFYFMIDGKKVKFIGKKSDEKFFKKSIQRNFTIDYNSYKLLSVSKDWRYFMNIEFKPQSDYQIITAEFETTTLPGTQKMQTKANVAAPPPYLAYLIIYYKKLLKKFSKRYDITDLIEKSKPMDKIDVVVLKGILYDSEIRLKMSRCDGSIYYEIRTYRSSLVTTAIDLIGKFLNNRKFIERNCEVYNNRNDVALLFNNNYMRNKFNAMLKTLSGEITSFDKKLMIIKFSYIKGAPSDKQLDIRLSLEESFQELLSQFIESYTYKSAIEININTVNIIPDCYTNGMIKLLKENAISNRFHYVKNKHEIICYAFTTMGIDPDDNQEYRYTEGLNEEYYMTEIEMTKEAGTSLEKTVDISLRRKLFIDNEKDLKYSWQLKSNQIQNNVSLKLKGFYYDVIYTVAIIIYYFEKDVLDIKQTR